MKHQQQDVSSAKEIADLNLTYILLAQKLLRQDRVGAMLRLGVSAEMADLLTSMSMAQVIKLAASDFLLCAFRLADLPVANLVQDAKDTTLQQAHLSILLAGRTGAMALAA